MLISEGLQYHLDNNLSLCDSIYREGSQGFLDLICEARKLYNAGHISLFEEDLDLINSDLGSWGIHEGYPVMLDYPMEQEADMMMRVEQDGYEYSHRVLSRVFENELGNEIEIQVRDAEPSDFQEGETYFDNGVYIRMIGPDSESSDLITGMEAKMLFDVLGEYYGEDDYLNESQDIYEAEYQGRKVKLNQPKRGGKKKFYVYVKNPKTGKVKKVSFGAKGMTTGLRDPKRSKSFEKRHRCAQKNDKTKPGYWACRIGRYPKVTGAPYRRWW